MFCYLDPEYNIIMSASSDTSTTLTYSLTSDVVNVDFPAFTISFWVKTTQLLAVHYLASDGTELLLLEISVTDAVKILFAGRSVR